MKTFLLTFLIAIMAGVGWGDVYTVIANSAYVPVYTCIDSDGNPVSGQTITLQINYMEVNMGEVYFFDFNDQTFKTSGWTTKTVNLTYNSSAGFYFLNQVFLTTNLQLGGYYNFIYDNASATYGDHQVETITLPDPSIGSGGASAAEVWQYGSRTLTSSLSTLTAAQVWDYNISGVANAGYAGKYLNSMLTAAQVWDYGVDGYVAPDDDGKAGLYQKTGGGSGGATAQEVWEYLGGRTLTSGNSALIDEIWNADTQLYSTENSAGYILKTSNVTPEIFWNYLLTNSTTQNSAGKILSDLKKRNY